jgi:5-formyltetrahydrofolate cyclo-ligase
MESNLKHAKTAVRDLVRAEIEEIPAASRVATSAQACSRLKQVAIWEQAKRVLFFAPLPDELDIWPLLGDALAAGKNVALPRFSRVAKAYAAARVQNLEADIQRGQFGIREPRGKCAEIPLRQLDLALVPGMAFDLGGRRLGRGRGFYDQLLAAVRGAKCGVAFDEQIVSEVPAGPHDVRMNFILTPTRWVEVGE